MNCFLPLPTSKELAESIGAKRFFTGVPCKHGHIDFRFTKGGACRVCANARTRRKYAELPGYKDMMLSSGASWRERNPDKARENNRAQNSKKREDPKKNEKRRDHYERNRERILTYQAEYTKLPHVRARIREYLNERYANDKTFKMGRAIRRMLRRCMLGRCENISKKQLGYTAEDLRRHLERNMLEGMDWSNYGSEWHIDHTVSVAEHIRLGVTDPAIINALSNLMPMWSEDNMAKGDGFALAHPVVESD